MLFLVKSYTNATSKWWHLWEIDFRSALNSTPGRRGHLGWQCSPEEGAPWHFHTKVPPPRTLRWDYAYIPMVVLEGGGVL